MIEHELRVGVLCLGASAGGLRSLEAVLSRLPTSFPWPVLVSQHLQPQHASLMPEILSRATDLIVREAVDGESALPGIVYTCPSSAELGFSPEGRLSLRAPLGGRPQRIDHLFSTAAFARPGLVVAVILSGTGTDGTAGSLVVKLNGGTVIAESEQSAQQSAMPRSAIKAGTVDATRTADAIAPLVVDLAEGGLEMMTETMRGDVREIARTLAASSGTDFTRYRFATLRRRIDKRRALAGVATTRDYHDLLKRDADERDALAKSLLLSVTEFFRDPPAWDALAEEVLPGLVDRACRGETIRVWCAGCASGEEAYTIAMVLAERGAPPDRVWIIGTDLDGDSVRLATAGLYDAGRMKNVAPGPRARFFQDEKGAFRVSDELRRMVEFRVHDLTRDPPPEGPFDLVICRNVLIYFGDPLQAQALESLAASLAPAGALFLGRSEAVTPRGAAFEPIARSMRIFRLRGETEAPPADHAPPTQAQPNTDARHPSGVEPAAPRVHAVAVEDSDAIVLAVDGAWHITLANRRARQLTSMDLVGKGLFAAFPKWLGSPIEATIRSTMASGTSVHVRGAPMPEGFADVTVEKLSGEGEPKLFLVATPSDARPAVSRGRDEDHELLREDLATTNDEIQTANEELAAANEELQASNEELQATNEELASLNEEFLSTNQNLASTNEEMQVSADQAQPAVDLLHAVMIARGDAIILCDASRTVTLVTPKAAELLGMDASAVGKRLDAKRLGVTDATLDEWLAAAGSGAFVRRETLARAGTLEVSIASLAGARGTTLGWLLTWVDPNMRVPQP